MNNKIILGRDPGSGIPAMQEYDDYLHLASDYSELETACGTDYHEPFVGIINEYEDAQGTIKVYYNKRSYNVEIGTLPTEIEFVSCSGITLSHSQHTI